MFFLLRVKAEHWNSPPLVTFPPCGGDSAFFFGQRRSFVRAVAPSLASPLPEYVSEMEKMPTFLG